MSVEFKNWKELCKEKDERIKELEGKFDLIVERLEDMSGIQFDGENESYQLDWCIETERAIEIVKEVGGMNE